MFFGVRTRPEIKIFSKIKNYISITNTKSYKKIRLKMPINTAKMIKNSMETIVGVG